MSDRQEFFLKITQVLFIVIQKTFGTNLMKRTCFRWPVRSVPLHKSRHVPGPGRQAPCCTAEVKKDMSKYTVVSTKFIEHFSVDFLIYKKNQKTLKT